MNILLIRTYSINIGNNFIDKGAKQWIKEAFPDADIDEFSTYSHRVSETKSLGLMHGIRGGKLPFPRSAFEEKKKDRSSQGEEVENAISVGDLIDLDKYDFAVLPGCVLSDTIFRRSDSVLSRLTEEEVPIYLLGAGGEQYDEEWKKDVLDYASDKNIRGIITRNIRAYDTYKDAFPECEHELDCAFFIDKWYTPPKAQEDFIASAYDKGDEIEFSEDKKVIRPDHNPFSVPFGSPVEQFLNERNPFEKENGFVSDNPRDYLFVYANAEETYSDRIHACVPALVYGNAVYFDHDTPRSGVLESVLDEEEVGNRKINLDYEKLENKRQKAVRTFRNMVKDTR